MKKLSAAKALKYMKILHDLCLVGNINLTLSKEQIKYMVEEMRYESRTHKSIRCPEDLRDGCADCFMHLPCDALSGDDYPFCPFQLNEKFKYDIEDVRSALNFYIDILFPAGK